MIHSRYHFLGTLLVEMSKSDERLEMELEALPWRDSKFNESMWVPKDEIPYRVIASLEQHHHRFYGLEFVYYLSKSGVISKYSTLGGSANYQPASDKRVQMGSKPEKAICPECGEVMDREHRGGHNHE